MVFAKSEACHILVAAPEDRLLSQAQTVLARLGCKIYSARTVSEAGEILTGMPMIGVVVCQPNFPDGDWRTLLDQCKEREPNPNLILLAESSGDPEVWKELLMLGGFDICRDLGGLERIAPEACRRWHRCHETEQARMQNLQRIKSGSAI